MKLVLEKTSLVIKPNNFYNMGQCCSGSKVKPTVAESDMISQDMMNWQRGNVIGRGAYGSVYELLDLSTGGKLAAKHIILHGSASAVSKDIAILQKEVEKLKGISHKNIVKYFATDVDPQKTGVYIIFEHVSGGSLKDCLLYTSDAADE